MSQSLAVKYRPSELDSNISGQDSIIKILKKEIETNNIPNTLLFYGASGCGKTTTARAFARTINNNQGNPIEIDAASNNGVDNVKEIVKSAAERSLDSKYKVYIIDECHSLTSQSWQAFLKCIEEPPLYTVFIFCTTEKNKVPDTIKNRCQIFNFNKISSDKISKRLQYICKLEGVSEYVEACDYISRICNNQMRDAISLLEKSLSYRIDSKLSLDIVVGALGDYSLDIYFKLFNSIIDRNIKDTLSLLDTIYNSGIDLKLFIDQFISFVLDLYKYSIMKDIKVTKFPKSKEEDVKYSIGVENINLLLNKYLDRLMDIKNIIKNGSSIKSTIEVMFVNMVNNIC